jgi:hypothetical protein
MVTTNNSYTWLIFTVSDDNPIAGCFPLGSHHIFFTQGGETMQQQGMLLRTSLVCPTSPVRTLRFNPFSPLAIFVAHVHLTFMCQVHLLL